MPSCGEHAKQRVEKIHEWRPRRSRFGELVQWDTSEHDWLEGRGDEMLLINMIDDATEPVVRSICGQRLDDGKHEPAGELCEKARAAAGILYRQGEPVSDGGETQT